MKNGVGLYLHIPYCAKKCPYCDFYSVVPEYTDTANDSVKAAPGSQSGQQGSDAGNSGLKESKKKAAPCSWSTQKSFDASNSGLKTASGSWSGQKESDASTSGLKESIKKAAPCSRSTQKSFDASKSSLKKTASNSGLKLFQAFADSMRGLKDELARQTPVPLRTAQDSDAGKSGLKKAASGSWEAQQGSDASKSGLKAAPCSWSEQQGFDASKSDLKKAASGSWEEQQGFDAGKSGLKAAPCSWNERQDSNASKSGLKKSSWSAQESSDASKSGLKAAPGSWNEQQSSDASKSGLKTASGPWEAQQGIDASTIGIKTVYFGGGTPSLMGAEWLAGMLEEIRRVFAVDADAEITLEVNPGDTGDGFFETLYAAGFNRVSIGMQSGNDAALKQLGRRHSRDDTAKTVAAARKAGFRNISLDVMLALPGMTSENLGETLAFALDQGVQHISAYLLKVEPGTPFARMERQLALPDEDAAAGFYFQTAEMLKAHGFAQYEISNFALPGYESRHNLVYWRCEEYLGFGPSAHSFYGGRRFYYPRDLDAFLRGAAPVPDGPGGGPAEYIMLKLRLAEGITRSALAERYAEGDALFDRLLARTGQCPLDDVRADSERIALTTQGFAVQSAILAVLLADID